MKAERHLRSGPAWAAQLERHGDAIAVVTEAGERLTYRELAARADAVAEQLGATRQLVAVETTNAVEPLVAYLGALRGHHAVILTGTSGNERLYETFRPSARFAPEGAAWRLSLEASPPELHPDLAVLLSTSGTTGATKLVRLSAGAIDANARSITEYLQIGPQDRAITSLPMHYSYGMSVVNSHLHAGARLLLTDRSVVEPEFWTFFEGEGATSIAGVPYTYELLERIGFRDRPLPSLRSLTQAGGRLAAHLVTAYAEWAPSRGARFYVMYGQTEASPRMAYLPPEVAREHPDCIGVPIPGGEFRLLDDHRAVVDEPGVVGELEYRGPNVMMGYATAPADLAKGAELESLVTGDLAFRLENGLYKIAGRRSRFAKLFGLRISLDEVEARLQRAALLGAVVSDDQLIYVAVEAPADPRPALAALASEYAVPENLFQVQTWDELPKLASGKIDYQAMLRRAREEAAAKGPAADSEDRIGAAFAHAFPRATVTPADTFVGLGGDSLNYVMLSLEVETALGYLPENWENLSVGELSKLTRRHSRHWWSLKTMETDVLLRALAVLAVVVNHASDLVVTGGAEMLMILAGYNLARYQKARFAAGQGFQFVWSFFLRIILPYYILLLLYLALKREVDVPSMLLVSNLFGRFGSIIEPYWFLEAIIQAMVLFAGVTLIPPVRRLLKARPWAFGLGLLGAALLTRIVAYRLFDHAHLANRTPDATFYLLALGWTVNEATSPKRRALVSGILGVLIAIDLVGAHGLWADYRGLSNLSHAVWLAAGTIGLVWVRRISIPSLMHGAIAAISAASFYIYLTHGVPLWILYWKLGIKSLAINLTAAVALGLGTWWASDRLAQRRRLIPVPLGPARPGESRNPA